MIDDIIYNQIPENDEGSVEYKRQLINIKPNRFEHLVTQMKYRVLEGYGECLYEIGINDKGDAHGLNEEEFLESLDNLKKMAKSIDCEVVVICEKVLKNNKKVAEALIREVLEDRCIDIRICICGNVDAGKSTLVGVLSTGEVDNGRGYARQRVFNHRHEVETGRTSSVSYQTIGFDCRGNPTNYDNNTLRMIDKQNMIRNSSKTVTLYDLAGHEKYLRTTLFGMSSSIPDYAMVVISANNGIQRMTKEHIGICLALKIPFFVVMTRIDICSEHVINSTLDSIKKLVKKIGVRKIPYMIRNDDDIIIASKNLKDDNIVPIFSVSSVTSKNIDKIKKCLNLLPVRKNWLDLKDSKARCVIDSIYQVPGIGLVVAGLVNSGTICIGETVNVGPDDTGKYKTVQIRSIQTNGINRKEVSAGRTAAFSLSKYKGNLYVRKGMVLLDIKTPVKSVWEFKTEIKILFHSTTIKVGYQPVIHCGAVKQSATITNIEDREILRTGDKAIVTFRFLYRPEYLVNGSKLIMRENMTRAIGMIVDII
mgnify:CR=1 FL=1